MRPARILPFASLALLLGLVGVPPAPAADAPAAQGPTVLYLVRHAEKAAAPADDPPLTVEGAARAEALARLLGDGEIGAVWSTDYARTRATAAPLAARTDVRPRLYDPRALDALADTLRRRGGRALVVGHSNTTPDLVRTLGGEPGPPIADEEYDRLYVVVVPDGGPVTTLRLRFGAPSPAAQR